MRVSSCLGICLVLHILAVSSAVRPSAAPDDDSDDDDDKAVGVNAKGSLQKAKEKAETGTKQFERKTETADPADDAGSSSEDESAGAAGKAEAPTPPDAKSGAPAARRDKSYRPGADGKAPTIIEFGITLRRLYNMKMNSGTFTCDILLTLRWNDTNAAAELLPKGRQHMTFSQDSAAARIWMPGIVLSNRNVKGAEVVSTSVTLSKGGAVTKIQRQIAVLRNAFNTTDYPFDSQELTINIASSQYFSDDVKLVPMPDSDELTSNVRPNAVGGGLTLKDHRQESYADESGPVKKSRGRLIITVKRNPWQCISSVFSPCAYLITMSLAVFWLPLQPAYVMPRVATSIISFMSLSATTGKFDAMIGAGAGESWGDEFLGVLETIMFFVVVNVCFLEFTSQGLKAPMLATVMNLELRLLMPAVFLFCCLVCWFKGALANQIGLMIFCLYGLHCIVRMWQLGLLQTPEVPPVENMSPAGGSGSEHADPALHVSDEKKPDKDAFSSFTVKESAK